MAISRMFFKKNEYYRICRTWDYRRVVIQKYVRIGKTAKQQRESLLAALAIDKALEQRQKNDRLLKINNGEAFFHPTGKIVGINRVAHFVTRASGETRDVHQFDIRHNRRNGKKPRYGAISVHMHGLEYAYELAVKKFAAFAGIDHNKQLMKLFMDSFKYYQNDPTLKKHGFKYDGRGKIDVLPVLEERLRIDFKESAEKLGVASLNQIEGGLLKELETYQRNNPTGKKHQNKNISAW